MYNLIEKTRQSLISQYGETKTEIVNGRTFKRVNSFLNSFDEFSKRFQSIIKKLNFDYSNYSQELAVMYEYFEQADERDIRGISSSLFSFIRLINDENRDEFYAKMESFFESIKTISQRPNFNIEQIKVCFAEDLELPLKIGTSMHKNRASKNGWSK